MKKFCGIIVIVLLLVTLILGLKRSTSIFCFYQSDTKKPNQSDKIIVIDPGHGGFDPGKIGVDEVLEKDINLSISLKLRDLLEKEGYQIIMTRTEDCGLYQSTDSNKKRADLKNRVDLINNSNAALAISIHQNSFNQESSKGAQVFYHESSEKGKFCAELMQETMKEKLADGNHRMARANDSYYMLRKTQCPLIIIECGFLSNYEEEKLLEQDEYQKKLAGAIRDGVNRYFKQNV